MQGDYGMDDYEKLVMPKNLRVCSECGGQMIPRRSGEYECINCSHMEYDEFGIIRKYLEENGPQPKEKIMLDTGVSRKTVIQFINEQRLQVAPGSAKMLTCERCGAQILTGNLCPACSAFLSKGTGTFAGGGPTDSGSMRFLGK